MTMPVWQLIAWSSVTASLKQWRSVAKRFECLGRSVDPGDPRTGMRRGQILWGGVMEGAMVGMAWDWREVTHGVVALADPMSILSNVSLVDRQAEVLEPPARIVLLNDTVYRLPWQKQLLPAGPRPVPQRREPGTDGAPRIQPRAGHSSGVHSSPRQRNAMAAS